jgi:hypothetical protein
VIPTTPAAVAVGINKERSFLWVLRVLCGLQQCPVGFVAEQRLDHKQLAAGARWPRTMILRGGLVGGVNDPPRLYPDMYRRHAARGVPFENVKRRHTTKALFSPQFLPPNFTMQKKISIASKCRHMHGVLNVDKIKN